MCYRKRKIMNRVLEEHKTGFDKTFIKAPCCSCPSCRKVKSNDWLVRSYFEFFDNPRPAFFCSLDFDNKHLPSYKGVPCFDSNVMKAFLKRLRYYIGTFRYFYATDYGGLLRRPHYHISIVTDDMTITKTRFFDAISKSWLQGHYTNVETLNSVGNDKTKAVQYVCGYVNKDITFQLDDDYKDMPLRFRPRIQASKGFGMQALETGRIDYKLLCETGRVGIPIGKNGKNLFFPIPRYYEMKFCYDYSYDSKTRKSSLVKNDLGVELAKIRHNTDYIHHIRDFFSTRHFNMSSLPDIDLSYFNTRNWYNVVCNCLDNFEDFKEFVYYRPFITYHGDVIVCDSVRNEFLVRPSWRYYDLAFQVYEKYKDYYNNVKCKIETEFLIESAKARARQRIKNDPYLRKYLARKNFDFSQLNF